MDLYQELRQKHLEEMLSGLQQAGQRYKWTEDRIRRNRNTLLKNLLELAREKSTWHHERLGQVNLEDECEIDLTRI